MQGPPVMCISRATAARPVLRNGIRSRGPPRHRRLNLTPGDGASYRQASGLRGYGVQHVVFSPHRAALPPAAGAPAGDWAVAAAPLPVPVKKGGWLRARLPGIPRLRAEAPRRAQSHPPPRPRRVIALKFERLRPRKWLQRRKWPGVREACGCRLRVFALVGGAGVRAPQPLPADPRGKGGV